MIPYEILIRGKDGKFVGAHAIDDPNGSPRPVKDTDWPDIIKSVNSESLARVTELETATAGKDQAAIDLQAKLDSVVSDIRAAVVDPETPTDDAVLAILHEATKEDRQKAIEEATRKRDDAQAELDKLTAA